MQQERIDLCTFQKAHLVIIVAAEHCPSYLSAILSTIVSVGTSRFTTRSTLTIWSSALAWGSVRGKPSSSRDRPSSRYGVASVMTKSIMSWSGTNLPSFMYCLACKPKSDSSRTCCRNKSPVDTWWNFGKSCHVEKRR